MYLSETDQSPAHCSKYGVRLQLTPPACACWFVHRMQVLPNTQNPDRRYSQENPFSHTVEKTN